ncbi:MAG: transketolase family protein [Chloroflexota bacterium]
MTLPLGLPMREVFGETVSRLANDDPRIVMLDGDLGSSTKADIFEHAHPDRFLQMGIAEQNMIGVAAGMATMGLMPFISTFVSFAVVRPHDQVRVHLAQTGANVKLTAGYAGLFTGMAGKTHHIVDDISIMRAMPGMITISPADDVETDRVLRWAAEYDGPVYVRIVRDATQRLFAEDHRFDFNRATVVREGSDVTLISTGAQTARAVDAAELLAEQGISAHVVHLATLKPLDVEGIVVCAERTGRVVTVEEHTIVGGLGGAVAETLVEHRPMPMRRIGFEDIYTESAPNDVLLDLYGLSAGRVAERVREIRWES